MSTTVAVLLQRRMGRPLLQSGNQWFDPSHLHMGAIVPAEWNTVLTSPIFMVGSQLLHQPQTLQERRHVLQHRSGVIHVRLSGRVHRHRLRTGERRLHRHSLPQRRHLFGKFNWIWRHPLDFERNWLVHVFIEGGDKRHVRVPVRLPRAALRDVDAADVRRCSVPPRRYMRRHGRRRLHVPLPGRLWRYQLRPPGGRLRHQPLSERRLLRRQGQRLQVHLPGRLRRPPLRNRRGRLFRQPVLQRRLLRRPDQLIPLRLPARFRRLPVSDQRWRLPHQTLRQRRALQRPHQR